MNQKSLFLALALATVTGAIAFTAGVKMREPQLIASSKDTDPAKSAPLCNITNQFATDLKVEIIESKLTSGTYFIKPNEKGMFFCGDKVKVMSKQSKSELTLTESIIFQKATPVENTKNI